MPIRYTENISLLKWSFSNFKFQVTTGPPVTLNWKNETITNVEQKVTSTKMDTQF